MLLHSSFQTINLKTKSGKVLLVGVRSPVPILAFPSPIVGSLETLARRGSGACPSSSTHDALLDLPSRPVDRPIGESWTHRKDTYPVSPCKTRAPYDAITGTRILPRVSSSATDSHVRLPRGAFWFMAPGKDHVSRRGVPLRSLVPILEEWETRCGAK